MVILGISGKDTKLAPELFQDAPSFQPVSHGIPSLPYRAGSNISLLGVRAVCLSHLQNHVQKPGKVWAVEKVPLKFWPLKVGGEPEGNIRTRL